MGSRKRLRISDDDSPRPTRKSSRIAQAASAVPTVSTADISNSITENDADAVPTADTAIADDPNSSPESSSSQQSLSNAELLERVLDMVKNRGRAELMVLELMYAYSFNFLDLKDILREHNLNVSFSNVKYVDIASKVGLDPLRHGGDIPTFPMYRARLTHDVFDEIIKNLFDLSLQYGDMGSHRNEEARSRFISGFFNKTVALFSGTLLNTPETLLEGRIASKGRMGYQFKAFGGITVLFIEVKLNIGNLSERLDFYAQVIAECDACAWVNFQNGYNISITAILCDGRDFYFFNFVNRRPTRSANPQFSLGKFADGTKAQSIQLWYQDTNPDTFVRQARPLCEALFFAFLEGYRQGLHAYLGRSINMAKKQSGKRLSTLGWIKAKNLAEQALKVAVSAWDKRKENIEESERSAKIALDLLAESSQATPTYVPNLLMGYMKEAARDS